MKTFAPTAVLLAAAAAEPARTAGLPAPEASGRVAAPTATREGDRPPVLVRIVEDQEEGRHHREHDEEADAERRHEVRNQDEANLAARFQMFLGFLSLIALVVTLEFTRRTARAGRDSAKAASDAVAQAAEAVQAASRSASAAEGSLELAARQFEIDNRPYISLDPFTAIAANSEYLRDDGSLDRGNFVIVQTRVSNVGSGIAQNIRVFAQIVVVAPNAAPVWEEQPEGIPGTVLAGGQQMASDMRAISQADYDQAKRRECDVFYRCQVRYTISTSDLQAVSVTVAKLHPYHESADLFGGHGGKIGLIIVDGCTMT